MSLSASTVRNWNWVVCVLRCHHALTIQSHLPNGGFKGVGGGFKGVGGGFKGVNEAFKGVSGGI